MDKAPLVNCLLVILPRLTRSSAERTLQAYAALASQIPGAPKLDDIQADQLRQIYALVECGILPDETWETASARWQAVVTAPESLTTLIHRHFPQAVTTDILIYEYLAYQTYIEGAPELAAITTETIVASCAAGAFVRSRLALLDALQPGSQERLTAETTPLTWVEVSSFANADRQAQADGNDLMLPVTTSKNPTRQNPFMGSLQFNEGDDPAKMVDVFRSFGSGWTIPRLLGSAPVGVGDILPYLIRKANFLDNSLGRVNDGDDAFLEAPSLAALAGLGIHVLREMARLRSDSGEAYWSHIAQATDTELSAEIIEARANSGYPLSLYRTPWKKLEAYFESRPHIPNWLRGALLVHIFLHSRVSRDEDGALILRVMQGYALIEKTLEADFVRLPFTAGEHTKTLTAILTTLGIKRIPPPKQRSPLDWFILSVFDQITPVELPTYLDVPANFLLPDQLVPTPSTFHSGDPTHTIRLVSNGAKEVDLDTGVVSRRTLTGAEMLRYNLPLVEIASGYDPRIAASQLDAIPTTVKAELPGSTLLTKVFRNVTRWVDGVDYTEEAIRFLDLFVVANLVRRDVLGSPIGNRLKDEFPGIFVGSRRVGGHTSSGQRKTTFAKTIANILCPGIQMLIISRQTGSVSQRTSGQQLVRTGFLAADEFKLPDRGEEDHWANRDGIQGLMTGSGVAIGKAKENIDETYLKYSPLFSGKYFYYPFDIQMRLFALLLELPTAETETIEEYRQLLLSGNLARIMRIQTLLWIQKNDIVNRIRAIPLGQETRDFRFPAFLGVYEAMYGEKAPQPFIQAMANLRRLAVDVCNEGRLKGQLTANKQGSDFDPHSYFNEMSEDALIDFHELSKRIVMSPTRAIQELLLRSEGASSRAMSIADALRDIKVTRGNAIAELRRAIEEGLATNDGWTMQIVHERHKSRHCDVDRVVVSPPPGVDVAYLRARNLKDMLAPSATTTNTSYLPSPPPPPPPPPPLPLPISQGHTIKYTEAGVSPNSGNRP